MNESIPVPGSCYKFTVATAEEAAGLIRERLGEHARVLSVRTVEPSGFRRLWAAPKLEVVAQIGAAQEGTDAAPESPQESAAEEGGESGPPAAESNPFKAASEPVVAQPAATQRPAPSARSASQGGRTAPATHRLASLLRRSGISEIAVGRLESTSYWAELEGLPLHRALAEAGRRIQFESERRWTGAPLARAAFLGSPGVGRTTALCKWLGIEVFRRARTGHVVTVEFDRPNPTSNLPLFGEALGVPVVHYPAYTQPATPSGFVYFDMPGISLKDPAANAAVAEFLTREDIKQRVLVLNAAYDHAVLRAAYAAGRSLGATHLVLTHLDEVAQWGRLWDYVLDGALEPLFLATGPSLTGDCEEDICGSLVRRTLSNAPADAHEAPASTPAKLSS